MPSLLLKVRKKMNIAAHRKVRQALEGEYASVFKGRSMDFDDLRQYVPGDDVKDIDWKASARSGQMLIRRYVAIRKNNILVVADTGRSMAATAPSGETKRDIAVMAAGAIVSVAQQHGNLIGLTAGDSQHISHLPLKDSRPHAERILQYIDRNTRLEAPKSDLNAVLDYVSRTSKKRTLMVVVSDSLQIGAAEEELLRHLSIRHEMIFIVIDDLDPSDPNWNKKQLYDVNKADAFMPSFVRSQKTVDSAYQALITTDWAAAQRILNGLGISNIRIGSEDEAVSNVIRVLEKHNHAHRRR